MFYYAASTFNGIVSDEDGKLAGTVVFTFQAGGMSSGEMQSPFTSVISWVDGKTTTLSGVADAEGYLVAKSGKYSYDETLVTKSGIYGTLVGDEGSYRVYAARNRYAMSNEASKSVVLTGLQATRGTWHVVLGSEAGESSFTDGYSAMAVTIAGMGQATIAGTLADGTKVSQSSTLIIGDGCCCLPVVVRSGKGRLAFMLWFAWQKDGSFGDEDASIQGLTDWTLSDGTSATFDEVRPLTFIDEKRYSGDAEFVCDKIATVKITAYDQGKKWKIAEGEENPNKLKVSYNPTTGLFSGSFAVEVDGKKSTAMVNGAFTDHISEDGEVYHGYGTAVIKGVGSAKVEITTIDQ